MDKDYNNRNYQEASYAAYNAEHRVEELQAFLVEVSKKTGNKLPASLMTE